jgi:hypothetical protein
LLWLRRVPQSSFDLRSRTFPTREGRPFVFTPSPCCFARIRRALALGLRGWTAAVVCAQRVVRFFVQPVAHSNRTGRREAARLSSLSRENDSSSFGRVGAVGSDDWAALMKVSATVRTNCVANSAGISRRHATVPRNSGAFLPPKRSLAFGRTVVKVICTIPPMFMMLKGPLTKSSGTLFGSAISIGPVGGCITGIGTSFLTFRTRFCR